MLTDKQLREIAENERPKYIYFRNFRKGDIGDDGYVGFEIQEDCQTAECTKCGGKWNESGRFLKHKNRASCPHCGNIANAYDLRYGRKTFKAHFNAVLLYAEDYNTVRAECVRFHTEDHTDIYSPFIGAQRCMLYTFTPDGSEKLRNYYYAEPIKKKTGYRFWSGLGTYWAYQEDYDIFWVGDIPAGETFLKYSRFVDYPEDFTSGGTLTYLCGYCEKPALYEFLIRAHRAALMDICEKERRVSRHFNARARDFGGLFADFPKDKRAELIRYIREDGEHEEQIGVGVPNMSLDRLNAAADYLYRHTAAELRKIIELFGNDFPAAVKIVCKTGQSPVTLKNYLKKQRQGLVLYSDYIRECKTLKYSFSDNAVLYPKNLVKKHAETSKLIKHTIQEKKEQKAKKRAERLAALGASYEHKRLETLIPQSCEEIINEGKKLSHCVGGYAESHANGTTTILFIRKRSAPNVPFFTLEIDMITGAVKQCFGYKNQQSYHDNLEIKQFLEHFQRHLKHWRDNKEVRIKAS